MSGGSFNYLHCRYEFDDVIEEVEKVILTNESNYNDITLEELKNGLDIIKKSRIYLKRIDYLLSGDDSEKYFLERLQKDLKIK